VGGAPLRIFGGDFVQGFGTWTPAVWGERFFDNSINELLFGARGVEARINALAEELAATPPGGERVATMPLYVLNYIWDGDELTAAQLAKARRRNTLAT